MTSFSGLRRPSRRRLAAVAAASAAAASLAATLPAAAAADPPGQVQIAVTCGADTFAATSGLGGSAAWVAERDGRRIVLLPASVTGTSTSADGTQRTFAQDLGGRDMADTVTCSFAFQLDSKGDVTSIAGQGEFVVRGA